MPITPSDIEHKTFSTALRGYDLDEVDDFLDEIVVALRDLHGELTAAKAKIAELEQSKPEVAAVGAVAGGVGVGDEASVGRVLILAQQAADRTVDEARAEAERLLEEARGEADRTLTDARTEADTFEAEREERRTAAQTEMAELTVRVASVRNQLALLATSVADKLDEMDSTIVSADLVAEDGDVYDMTSEAVDDGESLELALDGEMDDLEAGEVQMTDLTAVDDEAEAEAEAEDAEAAMDESEELDLDAASEEVEVEDVDVEDAVEDAEEDGVEEATEEVGGELSDEVVGLEEAESSD